MGATEMAVRHVNIAHVLTQACDKNFSLDADWTLVGLGAGVCLVIDFHQSGSIDRRIGLGG